MTTLHYPRNYTEEEELLLKKYAKLRKKKKALAALRTPKPDTTATKEPAPTERSATESAEIKEEIKKLVKTGAIKLDSDRGKKAFKRKTKDPDKTSASVGFQPFEAEQIQTDLMRSTNKEKMKSLYDSSFVSGSDSKVNFVPEDRLERPTDFPDRRQRRVLPKSGNTLCITCHGISESLIRETFEQFGTIVNCKVEEEKNRAFLTFKTDEAAKAAIDKYDKSMVRGHYIKASLARWQPNFDPSSSGSDSASGTKTLWGDMAADRSQKGDQREIENRDVVTYDVDNYF